MIAKILASLCFLTSYVHCSFYSASDIIRNHKKELLCKTCSYDNTDLCANMMAEYFCTYPTELKIDTSILFKNKNSEELKKSKDRISQCYQNFQSIHSNTEFIISFLADQFINEHCSINNKHSIDLSKNNIDTSQYINNKRDILEISEEPSEDVLYDYSVNMNVDFNLDTECVSLDSSKLSTIAENSADQLFNVEYFPSAIPSCVNGQPFRLLLESETEKQDYTMRFAFKLNTNSESSVNSILNVITESKSSGFFEDVIIRNFDNVYPEINISSFSYYEPIIVSNIVNSPPAQPSTPSSPLSPPLLPSLSPYTPPTIPSIVPPPPVPSVMPPSIPVQLSPDSPQYYPPPPYSLVNNTDNSNDNNGESKKYSANEMAALGVPLGVGASVLSGIAGYFIAKYKLTKGKRTEI